MAQTLKSLSTQAPPKNLAEANARIDELVQINDKLFSLVKELQAQVEELSERLGKSSGNSSRPPSSDSSNQRSKRRKPKPTGRKKGAQPGHTKHSREIVPEESVNKVHRYFPHGQCHCGGQIAMKLPRLFGQ